MFLPCRAETCLYKRDNHMHSLSWQCVLLYVKRRCLCCSGGIYLRAAFPPITGGGGGRIKGRLISNPGLLLLLLLLLLLSFSFLQFSLPAAARLLFHFSAAALFMRKRDDEGETSKMKMAAVCLRVPTTPCQLSIVIPSAACLP